MVLTKCDKPTPQQLEKNLVHVKKYLDLAPLSYPKVLTVSASKNRGIRELQADVLAAANIDVTTWKFRSQRIAPTIIAPPENFSPTGRPRMTGSRKPQR